MRLRLRQGGAWLGDEPAVAAAIRGSRRTASRSRPSQPRRQSSVPSKRAPTQPDAAIAATVNLTVTQQTHAGWLSVTPAPDDNPPTSTVNFPMGDTRANGVTTPLDPSGTVGLIYSGGSGTTDLVLDVTGYFR